MITDIIIQGLVGAVIGYFTNWLAIKMLFRPLKEKRIFGIKIPFTPGLIPKERERIAHSVGQAVGTHLLDEETLVNAIKDINIKEGINHSVDTFIAEKIKEDKAVIDILDYIYGKDSENFIKNIVDKLVDKIASNGIKIDKIIEKGMNEVITSGKNISDIIPLEINKYIDDRIEAETPNIACKLKKIMDDEYVELKMKAAIKEFIAEKAGFFGGFINAESIYDGIKEKIILSLDEAETQNRIENGIKEYKNDLFDYTLEEALKKFNNQNNEIKAINHISLFIDEKANNYIGEGSSKEYLNKKIYEYVQLLLNKRIVDVVSGKGYTKFVVAKNFIIDKIDSFILNNAHSVVKKINIEKLVEDKLNGFDLQFTEKLILDISERELKVITWLGGLLGLIIGIISPLLQHII